MTEYLTHLAPGTLPGWGTFFAAITALGMWWIRGAPDRRRAATEAAKVEADEHTLIRTDYVQQIKDWRVEVHALNNKLHVVQLEQARTQKAANEATAIIRGYEDDRRTMLLLIRLLLAELKIHDPESPLILHAEMVLAHMIENGSDPSKSDAMNIAEHAVRDAKQTVRTTRAAVEELKSEEDGQ